jgi:hypothetical protein
MDCWQRFMEICCSGGLVCHEERMSIFSVVVLLPIGHNIRYFTLPIRHAAMYVYSAVCSRPWESQRTLHRMAAITGSSPGILPNGFNSAFVEVKERITITFVFRQDVLTRSCCLGPKIVSTLIRQRDVLLR